MAALCRAKSHRSDSDGDLSWSDSPQPPQKVSSKRMSRNSRRDKNQSPGQGITVTLYKTELCKGFSDTGYCRYGSKCRFAHGGEDLRPVARHKRYKTERCKNFSQNGSCPYGVRCRFIHFDPVADAQLASDPSTTAMLSNVTSSPKRAPLSPGQGDGEHSGPMTGTPTTPTTPSPSYQSLLGDSDDGSGGSGRSSGRASFSSSNSPSLSMNGTPMSVSSTSTPLASPFTPQAYSKSTSSPGSQSSMSSVTPYSPAFSSSSSASASRGWSHVPVLSLGYASPSPSASASASASASTVSTPSHPAPPPGFPPLPLHANHHNHTHTNIAINPRLRRPSLDRSRSMNDVHDYVEFALQYDYDYQYGYGGDYHAHSQPQLQPGYSPAYEMQGHPTPSQMSQSPQRLSGEVGNGVEVQVPSRSPSASPFPSPFSVPMTATAALNNNNNDRFASSARRLFSASFAADPLFPSFEVSSRLFAPASAAAALVAGAVASPSPLPSPAGSSFPASASTSMSYESPMTMTMAMNLNDDFGLLSLGPDVHTQAIDSMLKDPAEESEQSSKPRPISKAEQGNASNGNNNGNGNGNGSGSGSGGSSLNSRLPFFSSLALDNRADLLHDDDVHTHSAPISLSLRVPRSASIDTFAGIRV